MEVEITQPQPLLDEKGRLYNPGWSRQLYADYHRSQIKANILRIKDWDYYYVCNGEFVLALTIADMSYAGLIAAMLVDLKQGKEYNITDNPLFTLGKLGVPTGDLTGDVKYQSKKMEVAFLEEKGQRRLICNIPNMHEGNKLTANLVLSQPPMDTMVIGVPWKENPKAFYYNQKINCMQVSGTVHFGNQIIEFKPENSFSTLDRGRGVWTYDNTWYWGSGNGMVNNAPFGFNIGYGFGDTTHAGENIVFFKNKGHKVGRLTFEIPPGAYCDPQKPWRFRTDDGRLDMLMTPVYDRHAYTKIGPILNDGHQIFGTFAGWCVLDDGSKLTFEGIDGFAEEIHNRY